MKVLCTFGLILAASAAGAEDKPLTIRVYSVADLAVDPPDSSLAMMTALMAGESADKMLSGYPAIAEARDKSVQRRLEELQELVQSVVAPGEWDQSGGPGRVATNVSTRSLIVRQHAEVHDEIVELLTQLRQENSVRIEIRAEVFEQKSAPVKQSSHSQTVSSADYPEPPPTPGPGLQPPKANADDGGVVHAKQTETTDEAAPPKLEDVLRQAADRFGPTISPDEQEQFRELLDTAATSEHQQTVQLRNGDTAFLLVAGFTPVVGPDRENVSLHMTTFWAPNNNRTLDLRDGESMVAQVLTDDGDSYTMLLTARVRERHLNESSGGAPSASVDHPPFSRPKSGSTY